ncbi:hypothetical protein WJR50_11170 [Catalinimonas sp. 4WD22]|uniref:hypothetical protein n=1 Tax=Catalinimonas locisalis TaxID=3133978 RepID=UPI003100B990
MKYFEFKYKVTDNGQIINQGEALYYTSAEQNIDEMKDVVRHIINDKEAVIIISFVTELDRQVYIQKGGYQNV